MRDHSAQWFFIRIWRPKAGDSSPAHSQFFLFFPEKKILFDITFFLMKKAYECTNDLFKFEKDLQNANISNEFIPKVYIRNIHGIVYLSRKINY